MSLPIWGKGGHLVFPIGQKKKLGRGQWGLVSCQLLLNSVQQFQRSRKCHSQSEARAAILFSDRPEKHKLGRGHWDLVVPRLSRKRRTLKLIRPSVRQSVSPSVTKTLTWLISFEVLMIEHWYLACMNLVTSPFYWYHAVTFTLTFDLLQGQICCRAGDHNSSNLLVSC